MHDFLLRTVLSESQSVKLALAIGDWFTLDCGTVERFSDRYTITNMVHLDRALIVDCLH